MKINSMSSTALMLLTTQTCLARFVTLSAKSTTLTSTTTPKPSIDHVVRRDVGQRPSTTPKPFAPNDLKSIDRAEQNGISIVGEALSKELLKVPTSLRKPLASSFSKALDKWETALDEHLQSQYDQRYATKTSQLAAVVHKSLEAMASHRSDLIDDIQEDLGEIAEPKPTFAPTMDNKDEKPVYMPGFGTVHTGPDRDADPDAVGTPDERRRHRGWIKMGGFVNTGSRDGGHGCSTKKSGRGDIFFYNPHVDKFHPELDESWLYHISTPWLMTHPRKIRAALEDQGFRILTEAPTSCEMWEEYFTVFDEGFYRGTVDVRMPAGTDGDIFGTYTKAFVDIRSVLEDVYPSCEIAVLILGVLLAAGLLGYVVWAFLGKRFRLRHQQTKRRKLEAEDDCVELRSRQEKCWSCGVGQSERPPQL